METILDFWLVEVYMKECELIKGGHAFGLLAVTEKFSFSFVYFIFGTPFTFQV